MTGSTSVDDSRIMHTGTGRISRLRMLPMSLFESKESNGRISIQELFDDSDLDIDGIQSDMKVEDLVYASARGGWPASLRKKSDAASMLIAKD